ncbi:MAG: hypothetical protein ACI39M_10260, partial [Streptomyces albidoflavus]
MGEEMGNGGRAAARERAGRTVLKARRAAAHLVAGRAPASRAAGGRRPGVRRALLAVMVLCVLALLPAA